MDVHPQLANGSFEHLKLGKLAPKHDDRTLRLARYLDAATVLPQVPDSADYGAAVPAWPMYGNDRLGDCTCAAAGHLVQAWTAAAGALITPDETAVAVAYIPGTGTDDSGRAELDVLNYWRNTGIGGDKIVAYAAVDAQDLDAVRAALWLFGGVYTGIGLPKTAQGQAVWDVVPGSPLADRSPGSWGGHAVPYVAFDPDGFTVVTWGATLKATNAFHLSYTDEVYAVLSSDLLKEGKAPSGFDLATLQLDLAAIADR